MMAAAEASERRVPQQKPQQRLPYKLTVRLADHFSQTTQEDTKGKNMGWIDKKFENLWKNCWNFLTIKFPVKKNRFDFLRNEHKISLRLKEGHGDEAFLTTVYRKQIQTYKSVIFKD